MNVRCGMNKHDQQRIDQVKRTLNKAKDQIGIARLYLDVAAVPDPIKIADMNEVEHDIEVIIDKLTRVVVST
jgi:hypothetical protein